MEARTRRAVEFIVGVIVCGLIAYAIMDLTGFVDWNEAMIRSTR